MGGMKGWVKWEYWVLGSWWLRGLRILLIEERMIL
jgi:hypothetical protein